MVFKPINLARSVISKTFPNGYAQSLVAASQSSSASHNTHFSSFSNNVGSYFGKPTSSHPSFSAQHASQNGAANAGTRSDATTTDRGLDAYYAAWHKHHRGEEKEWHQFQFAKRIGWKAPTTIPESQTSKPAKVASEEVKERPSIQRARSANAVDDLKDGITTDFVELAAAEVKNVAAEEVQETQINNAVPQDVAAQSTVASISSSTPSSLLSVEPRSPEASTQATSVSEIDAYVDHLTFLAENQRHAEIPSVFEALLNSGLQPTPTAYNALLLAAIHLPRAKYQVVPKVLDVYSDMLRRRVTPDTATYAVLIEVLAARALDVYAMQTELLQKQARFGNSSKVNNFLLASDETEFKILSEDDSLSLAIKLFDTSAAVKTNHSFPAETYRLLISACAERGRIDDMVRIYAEMESQKITPPTSIFTPMIGAFASVGDLRSAVECYEEYKALAVAHDQGLTSIVRQDAPVYAAVVKAYLICGQVNGGLKFMAKIEDNLQGTATLATTRDAIATQALSPVWMSEGAHTKALAHAAEHVSPEARLSSLQAICVDAADRNKIAEAAEALRLMVKLGYTAVAMSASAVMAAHIRNHDNESARAVWRQHLRSQPSAELIEPTTMLAAAFIRSQDAAFALSEARYMFSQIRELTVNSTERAENIERIDEAVSLIGNLLLEASPVVNAGASVEFAQLMVENGMISSPLVEKLLASLGPAEISTAPSSVLRALILVQAGVLTKRQHADPSHVARLSHLMDVARSHGMQMDAQTVKIVDEALTKLQLPELTAKWQSVLYPVVPPALSPTQFTPGFSSTAANVIPAYDDHFDPYGASTDFKGSVMITEELEKTYGRHSAHLNEALSKFKNIRRAGRHPRYVTYAKLISAAAKENRLSLAHDILAMAKQDVPLLPQSRVVTHGWVSILDAMVGACLTVGQRDAAGQFHQDLLAMGAAPSANTFGLYITTLKESTKTFDEATEAVKIFHRAKTEGVEPSSFLYNALIGKLGKARRIDDCLFYFAEMRNLGIRPTSVTYGTIVNALCRVSDDKFAEELFEEMESMPNYKPRPAPYNSLMQYFLTTKRDRSKVLAYYDRMIASKITPTMHTYKLLIDTHATLEPVDMAAAEAVLEDIRRTGGEPESVHHASLIHAKGCVLHDLEAARAAFDAVIDGGRIAPQASLYQAMFESMVANHEVASTEPLLQQMASHGVAMTPYIANTLIHGWAMAKDVSKARAIYNSLGMGKREPSTYEAMTRAYLAVEEHGNAMGIVGEALRRGYPAAVANKICDLVGGGSRA